MNFPFAKAGPPPPAETLAADAPIVGPRTMPVGGSPRMFEPGPPARPASAPVESPRPPLAPPLEPTAVLTRIAEPSFPERDVYRFAAVASGIWIVALIAIGFAALSRPNAQIDALTIMVGVLAAAAPLGLIWAVAYAVAQARILAVEAHRAKRLTDELVGPTALAAAQAGAVVDSMRGQIETATGVANQAREQLETLSRALVTETERLAEATSGASRAAVKVVETLSRERSELNTLALTLDARASAVANAITRQAQMVAEASDLAETQLRESEAALAARAADLAAAAGEAVDASRVASEDLGRQIARLETASLGVGDQMSALEDGLTQQRAALVTVAHALRAEQEEFSSLAETRAAQLAELVSNARTDVTALTEATNVGASSLSDLIAEARSKFRELSEAATQERDAFVQSADGTLKSLSEAGAREREHLEAAMRSTIAALSAAAVEAREAADVHAEAAKARVDLLNEAASSAGRKADDVFDERVAQAQKLIEQSAKVVEQAGEQAAQRLEAQVVAARASVEGLHRLIDEAVTRAARLPEETGARAAEIKMAVEDGLESLLATARRAAEETQAIDAAFQERVKRNYEMLSEAVQLMGVVAHGGAGASALQRPSPAERLRTRLGGQPPKEGAPALPAATAPTATEPAPSPTSATAPAGPAEPEAGLRGRLKLTPTATEDEFVAAYEAASGRPAEDAGWTWKELLNTLGGDPPAAGQAPVTPADPIELGGALFTEVEAMGIDPNALLPKSRIEEIAAAIQTGDTAGAREVVRALAPAAVRRVARRLLSDAPFRARAQAFAGRFSELIVETARRDRQGFETAGALGSNAGRAFLLLDSAAGQPG